jgi:hypothetical protein
MDGKNALPVPKYAALHVQNDFAERPAPGKIMKR